MPISLISPSIQPVLEAGLGAGAPFQSDRIVGGYAEAFTITAFDGTNGAFVTDAFYNVGQFFINSEGVPSEIGVATHQEGLDYQLYALFTATGTFTQSATGDVDFFATTGSITVYVDQSLDTGLAFVPAIPTYNAAVNDITRTTSPTIPRSRQPRYSKVGGNSSLEMPTATSRLPSIHSVAGSLG